MDFSILYALCIFLLLFADVESLRFFLAPNSKKCLKEEIRKNVVVTGEYEISDGAGQLMSIHVSLQASVQDS